MSRYRIGRPRADSDYLAEYPMLPDLRVEGPNHVDTGLVTETGEPIYRTQLPVGFGRHEEWS